MSWGHGGQHCDRNESRIIRMAPIAPIHIIFSLFDFNQIIQLSKFNLARTVNLTTASNSVFLYDIKPSFIYNP